MRLDWETRRRARIVRRLIWQAMLPTAERRKATKALVGQLRMKRSLEAWETSRRLFRLWHLFHAPLAQAMYVIVIVHILSVLVFGGAMRTLLEGAP
jgi:hypothetical protein